MRLQESDGDSGRWLFEGLTVLILYDFERMHIILKCALNRMDFKEILEAGNGAEAIMLLD